MNSKDITVELLKNNNFKQIYNESDNPKYIYMSYETNNEDSDDPICIIFNNATVNSSNLWYVHIDNKRYETIGGIELSTIKQFNQLMEIIGSNFRL